MIFYEYDNYDRASKTFSIEVKDFEFQSKESSALIQRFILSMLNRMACSMAGYYFKKNKEYFEEFIKSEECKQMIAKNLAERVDMGIRY